MVELTFLRHGRSQADDDDLFEGRYDSPLTEAGRQQALALLEKWKSQRQRNYDAVVTSPLQRAVSTATLFAQHYGVPLTRDDLLMEMDAGQLGGMKRTEGSKRFPPPPFNTPYDRIAGGSGESVAQLHARALLVIEAILNMGRHRYLVVAHGCILNAIIRAILSMPVPTNQSGGYLKLGDTGYLDASYDERVHSWTILGLHQG